MIAEECPPCAFVGGLLFNGLKGDGGTADKSAWQQYKLDKSLKTSQDYLACVTKVCVMLHCELIWPTHAWMH